jgi:hypothetical protein
MNTQISTKLAALGVALIMNSALIGGVAFLFNGQVRPAITLTSGHAHASAYVTANARI